MDLTADFQDFLDFLDIIPFFHGIPQVLVQNGITDESFRAFHECMVSCLAYGDISPIVFHGLECLKYIYLFIHNKILHFRVQHVLLLIVDVPEGNLKERNTYPEYSEFI